VSKVSIFGSILYYEFLTELTLASNPLAFNSSISKFVIFLNDYNLVPLISGNLESLSNSLKANLIYPKYKIHQPSNVTSKALASLDLTAALGSSYLNLLCNLDLILAD